MEKLNQVIKMVQRGLYVYPIVPNGKQPIKNYSYLKATKDIELIESWFRQEPNINIGINLSKSNLIVVDIDNHHNDLQAPLQSLNNLGYNLPSDYVERTQSGGLHFYYKSDGIPATRKTKFIDGVDLLSDFVVSSPSNNYKVLNGATLNDIPQAPSWIIKALDNRAMPSDRMQDNPTPYRRYYTGYLIDEIVTGVDAGNRNNWIASMFGKLLRSGARPRNAYELLKVINDNFISPPLNTKELDAVAESILKRFINE
ncbi:bifunctional DNA primase/polymerase [Ligilactobacillus salivarius]|uniref:bifunctional DNA primase/polymerase n=1 Tax=Ligilactobacillus salivarius TaxID=1624 RepID=UPI00195EB002|nr:bifunctional DNA primase/polymerase [Ligilactobacillus salivarius]MBM6787293.1 bifunctional DNA primase/polymerase [Ligilactobacillus salivarius]